MKLSFKHRHLLYWKALWWNPNGSSFLVPTNQTICRFCVNRPITISSNQAQLSSESTASFVKKRESSQDKIDVFFKFTIKPLKFAVLTALSNKESCLHYVNLNMYHNLMRW